MKPTIILDISANTHKNDINYFKNMLKEIKKIDTDKNKIVIKHQLFEQSEINEVLDHDFFIEAYKLAEKLNYETTASVFDNLSLEFLLTFDVPFVKIANNRKLDILTNDIPRGIPLLISYGSTDELKQLDIQNLTRMLCVSKYPASIEDYETKFITILSLQHDGYGLSDHTIGMTLYNEYKPKIYECHFVLNHDINNPDGGDFAKTIKDLKIIL